MVKKSVKKGKKAVEKNDKKKTVKTAKKTLKKQGSRRSLNKKYIKVCPECKSVDVHQDKSVLQQMGALPTVYICRNCGHSGVGFPEVSLKELEKFESEVDEKHLRDVDKDETELLDTSYGEFSVHFWWKIISPIVIILGILLIFLNAIAGISFVLIGLVMFYITYFVKRKLRD